MDIILMLTCEASNKFSVHTQMFHLMTYLFINFKKVVPPAIYSWKGRHLTTFVN